MTDRRPDMGRAKLNQLLDMYSELSMTLAIELAILSPRFKVLRALPPKMQAVVFSTAEAITKKAGLWQRLVWRVKRHAILPWRLFEGEQEKEARRLERCMK